MSENIENVLEGLKAWCEKEGFKGYDPFDGLNSRFFQRLPFLKSNRLARLLWIQFFKNSPLNLRPLLGVSKDHNPKALGLFISGYCNIYRLTGDPKLPKLLKSLVEETLALKTIHYSGACWGYNFDWQAKAFFQPKHTPTVVATSFIANSFLDAYEILKDGELLRAARSSCDFIVNDLNRTYDEKENFAFSYSPLDRSVVYNASLLGSRLLARVYHYTKETDLIKTAEKSVAFCTDHQHPDGSWSYGAAEFHKWIDSFHTGYNLECISEFIKYSGKGKYQDNLERGLRYYLTSFFTEEGMSKYYNTSVYPIDLHSPAQLIITLSRLGRLHEYIHMADRVLEWTIHNMKSAEGFFYYKKYRYYTNKIPYMRWTQAWMFYSLSEYLYYLSNLPDRNIYCNED